jgi:hypothetical protein
MMSILTTTLLSLTSTDGVPLNFDRNDRKTPSSVLEKRGSTNPNTFRTRPKPDPKLSNKRTKRGRVFNQASRDTKKPLQSYGPHSTRRIPRSPLFPSSVSSFSLLFSDVVLRFPSSSSLGACCTVNGDYVIQVIQTHA